MMTVSDATMPMGRSLAGFLTCKHALSSTAVLRKPNMSAVHPTAKQGNGTVRSASSRQGRILSRDLREFPHLLSDGGNGVEADVAEKRARRRSTRHGLRTAPTRRT